MGLFTFLVDVVNAACDGMEKGITQVASEVLYNDPNEIKRRQLLDLKNKMRQELVNRNFREIIITDRDGRTYDGDVYHLDAFGRVQCDLDKSHVKYELLNERRGNCDNWEDREPDFYIDDDGHARDFPIK